MVVLDVASEVETETESETATAEGCSKDADIEAAQQVVQEGDLT